MFLLILFRLQTDIDVQASLCFIIRNSRNKCVLLYEITHIVALLTSPDVIRLNILRKHKCIDVYVVNRTEYGRCALNAVRVKCANSVRTDTAGVCL